MTLKELKPLIKLGKIGMIPKWKGYIKWNYAINEMYFVNGDYIISELELESKIKDRNDLLYII